MTALYARPARLERLRATMTDPDVIAEALDGVEVPPAITTWLGRLHTLIGVPFGYLVPDEGMLPPESIRFFRLDEAWAEALIDGAFSLGRNLTADAGTNHTAALDRVVRGPVTALARAAAPVHRQPVPRHPLALSMPAGEADTDAGPAPWTGFLLRSAIVAAYPGLGVNVYPPGHTPEDPEPIPLTPRRLDRLGPATDTLLCLVHGEAYRVDLHEAPEQLHYGLDRYTPPAGASGPPSATKYVHAFTRAPDGTITFRSQNGQPVILDVDLSSSFRTASPRVLDLSAAAAQIATANGVAGLDSAQLGFEMTAGVGMVSFLHRTGAAKEQGR